MSNVFDTSNAPTSIPRSIVAGDYVAWRLNQYDTDYPIGTYTLAYIFRRESDPARTFTIDEFDDDGRLFEIIQTITGADDFDIGLYFWDLQVTWTASGKRATIDSGVLSILRDKVDDAGDPRSLPRKMLAEIERMLLHRAENSQLDTTDYSFGVESSASRRTGILYEQRDYWREELRVANNRWRARRGLRHSGRMQVKI